MSGFYLNELLMKLTRAPRSASGDLLLVRIAAFRALCDGEVEEPTLRRFEKRLLNDIGLWPGAWPRPATALPVRAGQVLSIRR